MWVSAKNFWKARNFLGNSSTAIVVRLRSADRPEPFVLNTNDRGSELPADYLIECAAEAERRPHLIALFDYYGLCRSGDHSSHVVDRLQHQIRALTTLQVAVRSDHLFSDPPHQDHYLAQLNLAVAPQSYRFA